VIAKTWLLLGGLLVVAVGVVAFVSLGHGAAGTLGQQVQRWAASTNLGQDIGTLEGDGTSVRRAVAAHRSITALRTACAAMANDAQTYNDNLPAPDATLTRLLARGYGLEYDAAQSCIRASSPGSASIAVAAADRARADGLFRRALQRVRALSGHTVPTTTTTVPDLTGTSLF